MTTTTPDTQPHTATQPNQLSISAQGMTFAAQAWGDPLNPPVLALHGWLDNSASFYRLAPFLSDHYVVALDTAGHGFSDHRQHQGPYNIWQDVGEVFAIADELGWERFALLGHSRGAIISTLCAGTFPERITHLGLLDGFMPQPIALEKAPEQLAQSIIENQQVKAHGVYKERKLMERARMIGLWALSPEAASALVERGVQEVEGGYCWRSDPRLSTASALKLSTEQIAAFVGRVQAPAKLLLAEKGLLTRFAQVLSVPENWSIENLPGNHHFHMEEQAEDIAGILNRFLGC
ncbi:alpha/beta fold hydrolase [Pseudomaricurvus sp.]|uniref:alpha/beta hydrolase n=1 Tax=Pseudomaricurvus sp. TaxID=2004510 RepID=UPI003F6D47F0